MGRSPLRVGLVGYGYASATFHAPLIRASPDLELVAVASSSPERVAADLPGVRVVPDVDALAPDVDVVVVATPTASHAPLAEAALRAGAHVVVEKPLAPTVAECDRLIEVARETGRVLSVFHNRRWDGGFLTARALRDAGVLGEILSAEFHFDRFRPTVRDRWRERPGPGAGMLYDLGSHLADQALELFGPPETVWADLGAQRAADVATDYAHLVLRWGRRRAVIHVGMVVAAPGPTVALHGTAGSYVKHGLDPQEDALRSGAEPTGANWGAEAPDAFGTLTTARGDALVARPEPTLAGDYPAFYAALATALRGDGPVPAPGASGRDVVRVLELAQRSAHHGQVMDWTHALGDAAQRA